MSSPCCLLLTAPPPLATLLLPPALVPGVFIARPSLSRSPWRRGLRGVSGVSTSGRRMGGLRPLRAAMLPAVDPWAPTMDSQSVASQLFAASLFPYLGFLYFITKSNTAPKLTLFGFYFLLAFVGATIPAGIYAKVHYGTSLSNVDWLHGGAESLLTLTNLFIVLGLRGALRKAEDAESNKDEVSVDVQKERQSSV